MKEPLGNKARLNHILESTRLILKFVDGANFEEFIQNEMMFSACIRHFGIVGEASSKLTEDFKKKHPEIQWHKIIGMRNILIHEYFGMDEIVIWKTIEEELPTLKTQIENILQALN